MSKHKAMIGDVKDVDTMTDHERASNLQEIKDEMLELLERARRVLIDSMEESRALAYWYAHIRMALDDDHGYIGRSMCTMQRTIDELETNDVNEES